MHLVHHHMGEGIEAIRLGVDHVAQNLGGHHDDGSIAIKRDITGEQADVLWAVAADEVVVLLVA